MDAKAPSAFTLRLRVPYWADGGSVSINGTPIPAFSSPSSYLSLTRTWKSGDVVELMLPMRLHRSHMPDDRSVQAVMYGPLVLAGRLGSEGLTEAMQLGDYDQDYKGTVAQVDPIHAPIEGDPAWVEPVKGRPLTFTTVESDPRDRAGARQRDPRRKIRRVLAAHGGLKQLATFNFQLPSALVRMDRSTHFRAKIRSADSHPVSPRAVR